MAAHCAHLKALTHSIEHASGQGHCTTFKYQNSYLKIVILLHTEGFVQTKVGSNIVCNFQLSFTEFSSIYNDR